MRGAIKTKIKFMEGNLNVAVTVNDIDDMPAMEIEAISITDEQGAERSITVNGPELMRILDEVQSAWEDDKVTL